MRNFPAHQLVEAETELASAGFACDRLAFDLGDHSDEIHWDGVAPFSAAEWIAEIAVLKGKLVRAEGLLQAYELFRKSNQGEMNDHACAG